MYEFWYRYVKLKHGDALLYGYRQLHFEDSKIFQKILKQYLIFHTSNFEIDRPLPTGKLKKAIVLMKDELGGKIMKEFVGIRAKRKSYLKDNNDEDKKSKRHENVYYKKKA